MIGAGWLAGTHFYPPTYLYVEGEMWYCYSALKYLRQFQIVLHFRVLSRTHFFPFWWPSKGHIGSSTGVSNPACKCRLDHRFRAPLHWDRINSETTTILGRLIISIRSLRTLRFITSTQTVVSESSKYWLTLADFSDRTRTVVFLSRKVALSKLLPHTRPNFSQPSSRIALVYQSVCSRTIADRLQYDWITE